MKHVVCHILFDRLMIYRDGVPVGYVLPDVTDDPVITLYKQEQDIELSFNDIAIIQDNWNQFIETKSLTKPENAVR